MLAVCGVSCEIIDGSLSVNGTSGDDLIALRYDAASKFVNVVGANEELVAQFPLADIRQLSVHGLEGNDLFSVDSSIVVPISLNGGEGEDALVANTASGGHQHGSSPASSFLQNSIEKTVALLTMTRTEPLAAFVGGPVLARL